MSRPPGGVEAGPTPLGVPSAVLVAVAAVGGPLALAALYAPASLDDVTSSAGLVTLIGTAAFVAPLLVWTRFARDIAGPGGLTAFVQAAAGRRLALAQGLVWAGSYVLYVLYTSAYVVNDVLPVAWPGIHHWQKPLDVILPIVVAGIVVAGRRAAVISLVVIAAGQLALLVLLDVASVAHSPGAAAFGTGAETGDLAHATGTVATLYVCASLPLFLGGDVARPRRTLPRAIAVAVAVAAVGVLLAVYPLASDPAFAHAAIPGFSLVEVDVGHSAAVAVGLGVAASIVGVMLLEYVALARLGNYLTDRSPSWWAWVLAVPVIAAGPVSIADPNRFYTDLLRPSLILLWISQLVVVAVFPVYLARRQALRAWHLLATAVGLAVMAFGLHATVFSSAAT